MRRMERERLKESAKDRVRVSHSRPGREAELEGVH